MAAVKRLPVLHCSSEYIYISVPIVVANFINAYVESQKKTRLSFSICNVFFVSKGNLLDFYSTLFQVLS